MNGNLVVRYRDPCYGHEKWHGENHAYITNSNDVDRQNIANAKRFNTHAEAAHEVWRRALGTYEVQIIGATEAADAQEGEQ